MHRTVVQRYFRAEVRGLESIPSSGRALVVSNHSGGNLTPKPLILAPAFHRNFGYDRPFYILAHYGIFFTPLRDHIRRLGAIHASRPNAREVLSSGAVVLVFPGARPDPRHSAFREDPDVHEVDAHVRSVMQDALDELARARRFPRWGER